MDGQIHFKGVGLVEYGAEPGARLGQMLAEDAGWAAAAEGLRRIGESVERL